MLDLRQLHYFVAVAEEGQMTRAAAKVHVAQPALSQAIAQLEARLGVELLIRHARGVSLTAAGESFLVKARAAVAAADAADRTAQAFARADSGRLELGHIGPPPTHTEPYTMAAFKASAPRAEISMRHLSFPAGTTASWLADVDVAICHAPAAEADVRIHVLREEPRVLIVPRSNPLSRREEIPVEDALEERYISFHDSVQKEWAAYHTLDDHRGGPPSEFTRHAAATPAEMLVAIMARSAVTVVPMCDANVIVRGLRGVSAVRLCGAAPMQMSLAVRKRPHNALVSAFVAAATAAGNGEPAEALPRARVVRAASGRG
jgi:LysR family transcriptional regulator, benzoate and cis,cis-muconate-responsive activator of ben and cat genes